MTFSLERSRPESCLSDLQLDRIVAGELAAEGEASRHLRGCATCRARLEELRREFDAFDIAPPHRAPPPRNAKLPPGRPRRPRRWMWAGALSTLSAAALLLLWVGRAAPPSRVRLKGGLQLELIARHPSGDVEELLPGATARPGDAVRFRVSSDRAGQLTVVGIDAARSVTPYAPAEGAALPFGPARSVVLDGSIILDETLGPERMVALLCPRAVPLSEVVAAARRALADAHDDPAAITQLPLDCAQASRLIIKRSAP